jgi:hypothetical protein
LLKRELDEGRVASRPIIDRGTEEYAECEELIARAGDGFAIDHRTLTLVSLAFNVRKNSLVFVSELGDDVA